ncbi:Protein TOXD [Lachnellula suecica]|uniref:Protein TOXD n=1 Tax=Lachnellula suecica TaxID=602035 RepID=A0A8T9C489_9HELO|nr:Protein TOXD [Lachnellula suecica]
MDALVTNRGPLSRVLNLASNKSIGQGCAVKRIPIPTISAHQILVKVHAVALNPIDFISIDILAPRGSIIGCDYAGSVAPVGERALGQWKVGDRVAGFVYGGLYKDRGSFCRYLKVDADLAWRVPAGLSDGEAASYGVSAATAMLALTVYLGLPSLYEPPASASPNMLKDRSEGGGAILIYAGSTTVGLFAIQLARKIGYTVVTTASPHSFELVKQYGADSVFDYHSPTAAQDIIRSFPCITQALDCISKGPSTEFCARVMARNGGKVVTLLDQGKSKVEGVTYEYLVCFTMFGEKFAWFPPVGPAFPVVASRREALAGFYANLPSLVGYVKPPPLLVLGTGFEKILEGLDELRAGKVSGRKLIVKLE